MACPISQSEFPQARSEPTCTFDSDCELDEKCCDWLDNQHCLKGIDKTPSLGN